MKRLVSIETGLPIEVGAVRQNLTAGSLTWVKVVEFDLRRELVQLSGLVPAPWTEWRHPKDIGAYFRDSAEYSLAGGRCSSTGLSGPALQALKRAAWPAAAPDWLPPPGGMLTFSGGHADPRTALSVTGPELDAILAGLALLREAIPNLKFTYDSIASQCWTNGGEHDGLGVEAVQALADRLNHGE